MKIINLDVVDSTNKYLKELDIGNESVLLFARKQTDGYGQFKRIWYSDDNNCITFSYKFSVKDLKQIDEEYVKKITYKFSGLINDYFNIDTYIKYPNDIFLNGKKICGVLVETRYCQDKLNDIVVGIGLNINNECFPSEIENIATSIYKETGIKNDINIFKEYLGEYFESKIIKE